MPAASITTNHPVGLSQSVVTSQCKQHETTITKVNEIVFFPTTIASIKLHLLSQIEKVESGPNDGIWFH